MSAEVYEQFSTVEAELVAELDHAELVESLSEWREKLQLLKQQVEPVAKYVRELEDAILEVADAQSETDEAGVIEGIEHVVEYGKRAKQVIAVDKDELIKALGPEQFMELASVPIGDIRAYTTPKQVTKILKEDHVGRRRLKVEPKIGQ